jgi:hypothetical protein
MKPLLAPDGTPLIASNGVPLVGESANCADCCDPAFNGCTNCQCFGRDGSFEIRLIVPEPPIILSGADEAGCSIENLTGVLELQQFVGCSIGGPPSICGGCFIGTCRENMPRIVGFHYSAQGLMPNDGVFDPDVNVDNDCAIYQFDWQARWFVKLDTVTHKLSVFLAFHWIGVIGCPGVCGSRVISYIRWEYDFTSCEDLAAPPLIRTMMWNPWGESPSSATADEGSTWDGCNCVEPNAVPDTLKYLTATSGDSLGPCTIHPNEWEASPGAFVGTPCLVHRIADHPWIGQPASPENAAHYQVGSLSSAPQLQITECQNECCNESGGPPQAVIEILMQEGCRFTVADASIAGNCGPIVRRLWILEQWEDVPSTPGEESCSEGKTTVSSDEFGLEYSDIVSLAAYGCGTHVVRITLYIWDEAGCWDFTSTGYLGCCGCTELNGDDCPAPDGTLIISQPDPENDPCLYRLTASIGASSVGSCDDDGPYTPSIRWWLGSQGSECGPEDTPACDNWSNYCGGGLADGAHFDVHIDVCDTIFWATQGSNCGCVGPVQQEDICCVNCNCCIGPIQGALITLSGYGNCPDDGINCDPCDELNTDYDVPVSTTEGGCYGEVRVPVSCTYDEGGAAAGSGDFLLTWQILCDEDGIYVEVNQGYELDGGASNGGSVIIFLTGDTNAECVDLSGSDTYTGFAICLYCNVNNVSITISFY